MNLIVYAKPNVDGDFIQDGKVSQMTCTSLQNITKTRFWKAINRYMFKSIFIELDARLPETIEFLEPLSRYAENIQIDLRDVPITSKLVNELTKVFPKHSQELRMTYLKRGNLNELLSKMWRERNNTGG